MAFNLTDLTGSVNRFLEAWRIVRICPDRITAPQEQLSFNFLTLTVVLAIFILARYSVAGVERGIASDLFATIISAGVIFVTGFSILIIDSSPEAMVRARKWGMFFVLTWIASLVAAILIDGIAVWNHIDPPTSQVIDSVFIPGTLSPLVKNSLRALIMGIVALALLLLKTWMNDPQFKLLSQCSIFTIFFGLLVNTALLLMFLYSNVI
ncbi:MAG: hypothetical protein ABIL01_29845 [Pseudomonadota bacterium]